LPARKRPNPCRIASSAGLIRATRLVRNTRSHSGSNFFHPAAYAKWRDRPIQSGLVIAPRRIAGQR
jgi:hypothetical protein